MIDDLKKLREPFPENQIGRLPKPTRKQTDEVKNDFKKGIRCTVCGGWHHPKVVHLDYVGHAALTDRFLDVDPMWNWEPLALDENGLPKLDKDGLLWIKLTICGVTRIGVGDAGNKTGGDAMKERIGDCLVSGTKITTKRGVINIDDVIVGDIVPTSTGWEKVTDHWKSHDNAKVLKVTFDNNTSIIATPHHKVPTSTGEKLISELRNDNIMYYFTGDKLCHTKENQIPQKILNGMEVYIGAIRNIKTCIEEFILCGLQHQETICTEMYGSTAIKQKYHQDGMSIIKMKTHLTTTHPIWSQSIAHTIRQNTGVIKILLKKYVIDAIKNSMLFLIGQNGVHHHAKKHTDEKRELLISDLRKGDTANNEHAMNVDRNIQQKQNGVSFVQVRVKDITEEKDSQVWNISVSNTHEYVANGILVNNSLRNSGMRFGAALDLWHKGDLHAYDQGNEVDNKTERENLDDYESGLKNAKNMSELQHVFTKVIPKKYHSEFLTLKDKMKDKLTPKEVAA